MAGVFLLAHMAVLQAVDQHPRPAFARVWEAGASGSRFPGTTLLCSSHTGLPIPALWFFLWYKVGRGGLSILSVHGLYQEPCPEVHRWSLSMTYGTHWCLWMQDEPTPQIQTGRQREIFSGHSNIEALFYSRRWLLG